MRKSLKISPEELRRLCINAEILEQDEHGIKVFRLGDGDIFKVFRVKNIVSSARIYSYARRFCRNAHRLQKLGIATITIKQLFHFEDSTNTAVLYEPLPGKTLWQVFAAKELNQPLLAKLGEFVARLHQKGIYFRSLHLGNIVLTPESELGLIDISDMSIFPWKLGGWRRVRNFRQFCRRKQGLRSLTSDEEKIFIQSYMEVASILPISRLYKRILREIDSSTKS